MSTDKLGSDAERKPAPTRRHECVTCERALVYWKEIFDLDSRERENRVVSLGDGAMVRIDVPHRGKGPVRELGLRQSVAVHWSGFSQALDLMEHVGREFSETQRKTVAQLWRKAQLAKLEAVEGMPYPNTRAARFSHFIDLALLEQMRGRAEFTPVLYELLAKEIFDQAVPPWVKAVARGWCAAIATNPSDVSRAVKSIVGDVARQIGGAQ